MSIFRKPLGTYTRSTPDWFYTDTAAGFGFCGNPGPGSEPAVGLYNNATDGRTLFVFGIGGNGAGNEVLNVSFFNGPGFQLTDPAACYAIDPTQGQPIGQIWRGLTATQAATPPVINQQGLYILGESTASADAPIDKIMSEHPLAVIRPGFMLAGWTFADVVSMWFQYVVMRF